jgi:hypothetical protein
MYVMSSIIAKSYFDYTDTLNLVRMQAPTAELHPAHFQEWYSDTHVIYFLMCVFTLILYMSSYVLCSLSFLGILVARKE